MLEWHKQARPKVHWDQELEKRYRGKREGRGGDQGVLGAFWWVRVSMGQGGRGAFVMGFNKGNMASIET